jgi:hypothetical protein
MSFRVTGSGPKLAKQFTVSMPTAEAALSMYRANMRVFGHAEVCHETGKPISLSELEWLVEQEQHSNDRRDRRKI